MLAYTIAHAVGRLHAWPNATLVPGFTMAVFLTCMGTLVGAALVAALFAWARDAVPAIGPALLVGIGTVALATRFGKRVSLAVTVVMLLVAVSDSKSGNPPLVSRFTEPGIQASALLLAIISAAALLHTLKHPMGGKTPREIQVSSQPGGTAQAMGLSGLWLAAYVLCLRFEPLSYLSTGLGAIYIGFVLDSVIGGFANIHGQLSRNWILPTTRSRAQLARRCAASLVGRSFAWFPAGVSATALQWLDAEQDPLLHVLLLVHIAVLLLITFLAGAVRPWPQKTPMPSSPASC